MLKSYSFMPTGVDISFYYEIWNEISKLRWYFFKFAGSNAEEAMQRTLMHTLTHFQPEKGNLTSYIKKLAREITKESGRVVSVDFLEQTLASDECETVGTSKVVDTGTIPDFVTDLVENMDCATDKSDDVVKLALEFMDRFVMMCEAILNYDISAKYYPDVYVSQCLALHKRCFNFSDMCIDLYTNYRSKFEWFLNACEKRSEYSQIWREADFQFIRKRTSGKASLVRAGTDEEVLDADFEEFEYKGVLERGRRIIKVRYYELWELMCDRIDYNGINEMKFVIGDHYIVRTLAGSQSVLDPDLYNEYDVIRMEILTNVLFDTNGRLLNAGSENFYLIYNPAVPILSPERHIFGIDIKFDYEDITDSIARV